MSRLTSRLASRAALIAVPALIAFGTAAPTPALSSPTAVTSPDRVAGVSFRASRATTAPSTLGSAAEAAMPARPGSVAAGSDGGARWWSLWTLIGVEVLLAALVLWLFAVRRKPPPAPGRRRPGAIAEDAGPARGEQDLPWDESTWSDGSVLDFFDGEVVARPPSPPATRAPARVANPPASSSPPALPAAAPPPTPETPPTSVRASVTASAVSAAAALAAAEEQARAAGLAASAAAVVVARYRWPTSPIPRELESSPGPITAGE